MKKGIYCIINLKEEIKYIGASINITKRLSRHRRMLKSGIHFNKQLQSDWNRLGEIYFKLFLLREVIEGEILNKIERELIEELRKTESLYNLSLPTDSGNVLSHAEETKEKIKNTHKIRKETNPIVYNKGRGAKAIVAINNEVCHIFDSLKEASEILELKYKRIQEALIGRRSCGKGVVKNVYQYHGFKFKYLELAKLDKFEILEDTEEFRGYE